MKKNSFSSESFLKYQSIAYLFIVLWAVLIANFQNLFIIWKYVELISTILFFIYFAIGLSSVVILIKQILRIYFLSDSNIKLKLWIVANISLYYGVLLADLYLSTQIRF